MSEPSIPPELADLLHEALQSCPPIDYEEADSGPTDYKARLDRRRLRAKELALAARKERKNGKDRR